MLPWQRYVGAGSASVCVCWWSGSGAGWCWAVVESGNQPSVGNSCTASAALSQGGYADAPANTHIHTHCTVNTFPCSCILSLSSYFQLWVWLKYAIKIIIYMLALGDRRQDCCGTESINCTCTDIVLLAYIFLQHNQICDPFWHPYEKFAGDINKLCSYGRKRQQWNSIMWVKWSLHQTLLRKGISISYLLQKLSLTKEKQTPLTWPSNAILTNVHKNMFMETARLKTKLIRAKRQHVTLFLWFS